jgi:hypothetical protein
MTDHSNTKDRLSQMIWQDANTLPDYRAERILAEFIVIPRSELPEVVERDRAFIVAGMTYSKIISMEERRNDALHSLAITEHVGARESEAAASEAKRNARRDELARQFSVTDYRQYSGVSGIAQKAIDRIIELEEAAA